MTLRELREALNKAPAESLDQDVSMWVQNCGHGKDKRYSVHIVEAVRIRGAYGDIQPWSIWLVECDLFSKEHCVYPEDDRRMYLSDIGYFKDRAKTKTPAE